MAGLFLSLAGSPVTVVGLPQILGRGILAPPFLTHCPAGCLGPGVCASRWSLTWRCQNFHAFVWQCDVAAAGEGNALSGVAKVLDGARSAHPSGGAATPVIVFLPRLDAWALEPAIDAHADAPTEGGVDDGMAGDPIRRLAWPQPGILHPSFSHGWHVGPGQVPP